MSADAKKREPSEVKTMFARVASRYDLINRAMCFGLDRLWRAKLVDALLKDAPRQPDCIDLACGSGDVALRILSDNPKARVKGVDFCAPMLEIARKKSESLPADIRPEFSEGDCEHLQFGDESFDCASIAFGFRNFKNRPACIAEIFRVLKPDGKFAMLEVARANGFFAASQSVFMGKVVPAVAGMLKASREDYEYLAKTTMDYPQTSEVEKMFAEAGFKNVSTRTMAFGLVAITQAQKRG